MAAVPGAWTACSIAGLPDRGGAFELYKLYLATAEKVSDRRAQANAWMLSVNSAVVGLYENAVEGDPVSYQYSTYPAKTAILHTCARMSGARRKATN